MKRFYKLVSTQSSQDGYLITLDGRPVKTALKKEMLAPNEHLANALVVEWSGQQEEINPDSMPLTQILSTKIDRVSHEREAMQKYVFKYLDTDLLCYRTDHPPELQKAQEEMWNPHLEWFAQEYGTPLETTFAITALKQPDTAHEKIRSIIKGLDDDRFTAFQLIVSASGSLVLGLAAINGKLTAEEIYAAMRVEENFKAEIYNEEFYGADPAQEKKDMATQEDLRAAMHYLSLLD